MTPVTPATVLIWTCVVIFIFTAAITLLGIIEKPPWVTIPAPWLKPLYGVLLLEIATIGVVPFKENILSSKINPKPISEILQEAKTVQDNDYLRILFLKQGTQFTGKLGRKEAARVFVAPSSMFNPPVTLGEAAMLTGNDYREDEDVYIIRCQPTDNRALEPRLATWQTVFELIKSDFPSNINCVQAATDEEKAYCIVSNYSGGASPIATVTLAKMFNTAAELYSKNLNGFLKERYGISQSSFLGLGETVRGAGVRTDFHEWQLLTWTTLPEYLVKNVKLGEGSCKCIVASPYSTRQSELFSLEIFDNVSTLGECTNMSTLHR
jgi:hypothetical protein